jgi:hypothetical protein
MSPSPPQFSLGKWKRLAMEEKSILAQTHNVVAKYWGKGGILKWVDFLFSLASLWNGTPTPYFIGQKDSNGWGDWLWAVNWLGNGPKTRIPLQFSFFVLFCEGMWVVVVHQVCVCGQ